MRVGSWVENAGTVCIERAEMDPKEKFTASDMASSERLRIVRGQRYRVTRAFTDADGVLHPVGEEWTFTASKFSRFEDEYVISVRFDAGGTMSFGLICQEDRQYGIIRNFSEYVVAI